MNVPPPSLFQNLTSDCKSTAIKSRKYTDDGVKLIEAETKKLLAYGITESSNSPWKAQVLLTTDERHKKRTVIDYSQTINRYTQLNGYPLPNINNMIKKILTVFSVQYDEPQECFHQIR